MIGSSTSNASIVGLVAGLAILSFGAAAAGVVGTTVACIAAPSLRAWRLGTLCAVVPLALAAVMWILFGRPPRAIPPNGSVALLCLSIASFTTVSAAELASSRVGHRP